MRLSPNFTLDELIYSTTARKFGIQNEPGAKELENLVRLCETLLEPAREIVGPLAVNSGFRSAELNRRVGGVPTSAHQEGRACDVKPISIPLESAFDILRESNLIYDQIILEPSWLHLGIASDGVAPRRNSLIAHVTPHGLIYEHIPS